MEILHEPNTSYQTDTQVSRSQVAHRSVDCVLVSATPALCRTLCRSAACFFTKTPARHEVLNDLNGSICTLFRVLRERCDELVEAITLTPWCEEEYERFEKDWYHENDVEHARRFLLRCWQAHGGTIYQVSGWKHNGLGGHAYLRLWRQLPERLLATVDRLRDAEIRTQPALDLIEYYNAPDVVLCVDPPYMLSTRARKYYPFEMMDADHVQLLDESASHSRERVVGSRAAPLGAAANPLPQRAGGERKSG